jgi:hypothetical protein
MMANVNEFDYSQYECPFAHLPKDCGHELNSPYGFEDEEGLGFRIWCSCGFRGPVLYLDPEQLGLKKRACKDGQKGEIVCG